MDDNLKQTLDSHIAKFDHLAISLMPQHAQKHIFILYSFFAELDGLAAQVSEPMLGEIRCQWWREIITNQTAQSPLSQSLLETIEENAIPTDILLNMIDAKIFDLYANPMETKASFEAYAGQTYSALLQLSANIISPQNSKLFTDISGHLGVAFGVSKSISYLKVHQSRGQIFIPNDFLFELNISNDDFLSANNLPAMNQVITAFAKYGHTHYLDAKKHLNNLDKPTKNKMISVLYPMLRSQLVLNNTIANQINIYKNIENIFPSQLSFQWQLIKANLLKKI